MAAGSRRGDSIHWRSRRPPIGVTVASRVSSSVQPAGAGAERLDQLEVAPGHLVEPEEGIAPADHGAGEVGQARRLELGEVAQQGARGADGGRVVGAHAEAVERGEPNRRASSSRARSGSNSQGSRTVRSDTVLERRARRRRGARPPPGPGAPAPRRARRRRAVSSRNSPVLRSTAASPHRAALAAERERDQEVVPRPGQPALLHQRAGRHRLDHLAAHQPPGQLRVLHLLADGDAVAGATSWRR